MNEEEEDFAAPAAAADEFRLCPIAFAFKRRSLIIRLN